MRKPVVIVLMLLLPVITYYFTGWIRKNNVSHYDRPNDPRVREAKVYITRFLDPRGGCRNHSAGPGAYQSES